MDIGGLKGYGNRHLKSLVYESPSSRGLDGKIIESVDDALLHTVT